MAGLRLNTPEKIVVTRKRLGETQEKFGERFSVKKLTVTQWERGESDPTPEHLALLRALFQEVLGEEDESQFETAAYQLMLPFDEPVKIEFSLSPLGPERVRFGLEVRRKAS
jgi:transcriptional regulator with XRE-family HTH domain